MHKQSKNQKGQANGTHLAAPKRMEVVFALDRPDAKEVYLCGDFNQWSPMSLRMFQRDGNGRWEKRIILTPGRYEYKFIIDGEWVHDAGARDNAPNAHGSLNSVVEVP
jgi:1,4-alpha-glucan branching enzyme